MPVLGIGGVFLRSDDPETLGEWYQRHFGFTNGGPTPTEAGPMVFSTCARDTDYFGGPQSFMINLRVSGLKELLQELAAAGVKEVKPQETMEGIGRFAWVNDPEGNRIELWEPA